MFVIGLQQIALLLVSIVAAYFTAKWAFGKDTEKENRRRSAAKLAAKLQSYGLKRTPEFLIDYSVGDYSGMANKIQWLAELFLNGESAVVAEFDDVFKNVLDAKLQTEEGRALLAAKLGEVKPAAPAVA